MPPAGSTLSLRSIDRLITKTPYGMNGQASGHFYAENQHPMAESRGIRGRKACRDLGRGVIPLYERQGRLCTVSAPWDICTLNRF